MFVRRVLILAAAAVLLSITSQSLLAQRNNQPQRPPQEEQDVQALVRLVDVALMSDVGLQMPAPGAPPPTVAVLPSPLTFGAADRTEGAIGVTWRSNHFVKGQGGDTYVPLAVSVDKSRLASGAALYIRIVNAEQAAEFGAQVSAAMMPPAPGSKPAPQPDRPRFSWDTIHFVEVPDDGRLERAVQLPPGQYVAFVAVKERSPAPPPAQRNNRNRNDRNTAAADATAPVVTGLLRHEITVPNFEAGELQTSSVILATVIEPMAKPLPPNQQEANPYVFGPMRIVPSVDGRFLKSGELSVLFWIYGAKEADGKPDVTVEFNFHQRLAEGERYFNRTEPQTLNAETLPPEFSLAAGHQLPGSLTVPLASFPAGDYRLEIKVTDKAGGASVTENVNFSVLPV
jgi:hypothetical protein